MTIKEYKINFFINCFLMFCWSISSAKITNPMIPFLTSIFLFCLSLQLISLSAKLKEKQKEGSHEK